MQKNKIAITTGDLLGIGEEITQKALLELKIPKEKVILIGRNLGLDYEYIEVNASSNGEFCYKSLEIACDMAQKGEVEAIVTAPVSKKVLSDAGYHFLGQTEILENLLAHNGQKAEMLFIAKDLRLLLLTRHLPLKKVELSQEIIVEKIFRLNSFLIQKCGIKSPKIALCALNPHAGEQGLLGTEEIEIMQPAIKILHGLNVGIFGPFAADGLMALVGEKYLSGTPQEYDAVVSPYHDQGLCAIKALAFDEVVNTTIGLDIIRTSPSCGTAYDIKGKNIAKHKSMSAAIKLALNFS